VKTSHPRVMEWAKAAFQPRFEHGDQAQAAHLCGTDDDSKLGAGFGRLSKASFEWTVQYDEIILVLEGEVTALTDAGALIAGPKDTIWLPAGTRVTYQAEDALIFMQFNRPTGRNLLSRQGLCDHGGHLAPATQRPDKRLEYDPAAPHTPCGAGAGHQG
jgi:ethanolamine utilization protein EutQ